MKTDPGMHYKDVGVLTNQEIGLDSLLRWITPTLDFRKPREPGRSLLGVGYFANVIDIGHGLGLAMTTDGVGTKVLIAELLERYDTIGIDCVAMNVNDLICVGAEPIAMLDYIGIEQSSPKMLEEIGRGLHEGAKQARISVVGGEISQMQEVIKGVRPGRGLDLVGMCVGIVPADRINTGKDVKAGDAIIGLRSSGIHSNGLTLARKVVFEDAGMRPDQQVADLGRTIGEELLVPTHIYVPEILDLLSQNLPVGALLNITSDGFLNLARIESKVGFRISFLPPAQPIFGLIQELGGIDDEEMYRVFNMGIGFCLICPNDPAVIKAIMETMKRHDVEAFVLGTTVEDADQKVHLETKGLIGHGDRFYSAT